MKNCDFAYYVTKYLSIYLPSHCNLSKNTIISYRDTFSVFLSYCNNHQSIAPEKITFSCLTRKLVEEFLLWLEGEGGCSIATRNQRLTALRSFFRYVQIEAPEHLLLCQSVITIKTKKQKKPIINYLTYDGIKAVLAQPNTSAKSGCRDLAMLELLYDTAARVQELCDLSLRDVRLTSPATVTLHGKGDKSRCVPIIAATAKILNQYITMQGLTGNAHLDKPLFRNRVNKKLTRGGVAYILSKYIEEARLTSPEHIPQVISPHSLRHSKAMHLVESGVNIVYIRDLLGHEDIKTTGRYAKSNPEMKRNALLNAFKDLTPEHNPTWNDDPDLIKFLRSLGQ